MEGGGWTAPFTGAAFNSLRKFQDLSARSALLPAGHLSLGVWGEEPARVAGMADHPHGASDLARRERAHAQRRLSHLWTRPTRVSRGVCGSDRGLSAALARFAHYATPGVECWLRVPAGGSALASLVARLGAALGWTAKPAVVGVPLPSVLVWAGSRIWKLLLIKHTSSMHSLDLHGVRGSLENF